MRYYIKKDQVSESIEYFKNAGFDTDDMLFLFLMAKHMGVSASYPVTFLNSALTAEQKKEELNSLWLLGGLFDSEEMCSSKGVMFPTAFRKMAFYQPGTEFNKIPGRMKDTVEKKNINVPIFNDVDSKLTLRSNYKDLIDEKYLKGQKISLSKLAAWTFRFSSFEFDSMPNEKQFSRVLDKAIKKYFKITKNDFLWLFEDDISNSRLIPDTDSIKGQEVRNRFDFDATKMPEVNAISAPEDAQVSVYDKDTVAHYLALNGDNPSDSDIFDILMNKEQIVLTGVPGVGKSRYTKVLTESGKFADSLTIQFHANYSYEDFIGAEVLRSEDGGTYVTTKQGVFLKYIEKVKSDPDKSNKYLLVIDELNRGNIAEIFGESILALDRNYEASLSKEYEDVGTLSIPHNLYIVATMNTSDRNIAFLDLAIRRRFAFVPLLPNYDFLSEEVIFQDFDLGNILKQINQRIIDTLKAPELILGQSYFIPKTNESGKYIWEANDFKNQFNFVLLPTLREYSFNNASVIGSIVGENLSDGIQDLDDFMVSFSAEFGE